MADTGSVVFSTGAEPAATGTATGTATGDIGNVASKAAAAAESFLAATVNTRCADKDDVAETWRAPAEKAMGGAASGDDDGDNDDGKDVAEADDEEDEEDESEGDEEGADAEDASNSRKMSAAPDSRFRRGTQEESESA
jgi:hypothetical protein